MAANEFGTLLKALRLSRGYGLRQFAEMIGELPSNLSAVEHGKRKPWQTVEKLRRAADALAISEGSREWDRLFFAAKRPGRLPPDVEYVMELEMFPVLCRTVNEMQLTDDDLRRLVEYLRNHKRAPNDDGH